MQCRAHAAVQSRGVTSQAEAVRRFRPPDFAWRLAEAVLGFLTEVSKVLADIMKYVLLEFLACDLGFARVDGRVCCPCQPSMY